MTGQRSDSAIGRYRIADYLTIGQKRTALAQIYQPTEPGGFEPRCVDGYCPLGRALGDAEWRTPPADHVAGALQRPDVKRRSSLETIGAAAYVFIEDWDGGLIPPAQLAVALGMPEEDRHAG